MPKIFQSAKIIRLTETESTNTHLSSISSSLPQGSVVVTNNQIHGRGQGKNKWESEPGKNLTFSILLFPDFLHAGLQFYVSKIVALSVSDLMSLYTDRVAIKWPNDIYLGDQKVAGILIENSIEGVNLKQSIAGIGINVNQSKFTSDAPNPVSLFQVTHQEYPLDELLETLINIIEYRYNQLRNKDFSTIDINYLQILYRKDQESFFIAEGVKFKGTIIGVDPTGELNIRDDQGIIRKFWHKEVEFVI